MKTEDFYVVVIDDKQSVCDKIATKLAGTNRIKLGNKAISISVKTVNVKVKRKNETDRPENDIWTFSDEMIDELSEAAYRKPDLLIVDYIYIDKELAGYFKSRSMETEIQETEIKSRALNPIDLIEWAKLSENIDNSIRKKILNNIFNFSGPVYLHTYTPQGLYSVTGNITDRSRKTSIAFPNAGLTSIDTHIEFFNSDEFDWPNKNSKYDKDYYPYQLAVYFDQVALREIVQKELHKKRYLRVQRITKSVSVISAIGASVGFAAGWIGTMVYGLIDGCKWSEGFIFGLFFIVILLIAGFVMPLLFEYLMSTLLKESE